MVKKYLVFILLVFILVSGSIMAQQKELWIDASNKLLSLEIQKDVEIKSTYQAFELAYDDLKNSLFSGLQKSVDSREPEMQVQFPMSNGQLVSFIIKENSVMHPNLEKKFPENKSYSGYGAADAFLKINFSINALGLHAMIIDHQGKVEYIDPLRLVNDKNHKLYQVYKRGDISSEREGLNCEITQIRTDLNKKVTSLKSYDQKLRTYRIAIAATGEYSQYQIALANGQGKNEAEQIEIVFNSIHTAITRINYLFENDLAIHFELVKDNKDIIFLTEGNPYTQGDTDESILNIARQNQSICDRIIGVNEYDVGQVLTTMSRGYGEGFSVCKSNQKGRGTSGAIDPIGDAFYFNMVAHELGHQFGANHTYNGYAGSCENGRNNATAVEPGSGSTIMAYAGSCELQNVQRNSDLYFHSVSIQEIWNNISSTGACAVTTELQENLNRPSADAGADFTIPKGTAFKLVGTGEDADGDLLTYCWEQIDRIGTLYRSYPPSQSNTRYLPALKELKNGAISTTWEVTPTVARDLNFSLNVRDNNPEAGQVAIDELKVSVTDAAGPFVVTSQNTPDLVWDQNSDQVVTWDVAGTDDNGVNVSSVNILLSTDGGLSYPTTLKENTPNDGSENIRVPFFKAGSCYLMVEAVDNYFFAINRSPFSIGENSSICEQFASVDVPLKIPDNDAQGVASVLTIDREMLIEDIEIFVEIEHNYVSDLTLEIESPTGTKIALLVNNCGANSSDINAEFSDQGDRITCNFSSPEIRGLIKPVELLSSFSGENAKGQWVLRVKDEVDVDVGSLVNWGMTVCSYQEVLANKTYQLKGFSLFPNPAEESFQLNFDLKSDQVKLFLYDALGRTIWQHSYRNNSSKFNERIQTSQLKPGLYFLKVVNGDAIATERVLVR